jgi:hypothetical protein
MYIQVTFHFGEKHVELCKTCFFKNLQSGQREVPPSRKNWSVTLRGLEEIVTSLKDLDFNFLFTRNINQDPLENFFCQIRQAAWWAKRRTNPYTIPAIF